jgi:monofunctional biosynthetic peptidoglycan transglycosylase
VAPKGFTRRYGNIIAARIPVVARDGLDACIYKGEAPAANKTAPVVAKKPRPIPGEEFETPKSLPPVENVATEPDQGAPESSTPAEQPKSASNGV